MDRDIGFIGLGAMGLPMVENLASVPGLRVLAWDASAAPLERLAGHPAWQRTLRAAGAPGDLADCDVVITMLPDSPATDAVVLGTPERPGLAGVLRRGAVVVDMGSSNPVHTRRLAGRLAESGIALVDAPVSGAVAKARTGELAIMLGGPEAAVERVRPLLEHLGSRFFRTGPTGSAHAMKALNNYVYAAGLLAACEATGIAERAGLDTAVFADVLNASSGRNVATETKLRQFILPRTFSGGFALRLQAKDLATAQALQADTGSPAPQLALCHELWQRALAALGSDADNTAIYRYVTQD